MRREMLAVTERARQELKRMLTANTDKPETCLLLTADDQGQLGLAIDVERQGVRRQHNWDTSRSLR